MNDVRSIAVWAVTLLLGVWTADAEVPKNTSPDEAGISSEQIEADWLRQDEVRGLPVAASKPITPEEDAAGACDGIKGEPFGFHTALEDRPWWQIDLGRLSSLDEIFIFNRTDACEERAASLMVMVSGDAKTWEQVYQHDGSPFSGWADNRPLVVRLAGQKGRYVRIQLPGRNTCLHLDEVEIYPTRNHRNIALRMPATQSSASRWSRHTRPVLTKPARYATEHLVRRNLLLAENLRRLGARVDAEEAVLRRVDREAEALAPGTADAARQELYFRARRAGRRLALANPLLDFDDLLLVKRLPAQFKTSPTSRNYTHMSDQYYGWFSRPGGGLFVLQDFKSEKPRLRCLTAALPPGNIIRPDLSYDGTRVLFAFCRYFPGVAELPDKVDKSQIPEEAFYHLYEMNIDGSGLRRLTRGKYDDFDGRYLPDGRIVFLSTRRGQHLQCTNASARASCDGQLPDSYVRCGGDEYRPVAVYTLHVMNGDGGELRQLSPFAMFEWTPSVDHQGNILFSRWDYVDRDAMPYMGLWSMFPDGAGTRAIFGNYTRSPHCVFEPRSIPDSHKIIFTASAHHSNTAGSLVLLDPGRGTEGNEPMKRLTPEVAFPEIEAWPETYFANPWPLSEDHYLVAWSDKPLKNAGNDPAALGIYLFDAFGNLNLICRDPDLSCMYPIPIRPRSRPPQVGSMVDRDGSQEGQMLVTDIYRGLESIPRGSVRGLRIVGVPAKTHPRMNAPVMGLTRHDPGKFVLGTVPVEPDGSANFRVPSGVPFFMQALDADGMAVQTMRSAIYVQPGERITCIGCHEPRDTAPPNRRAMAAGREPSKITLGPEGSWPLNFEDLVEPVIQRQCHSCHRPGAEGESFDLTAEKAYQSLVQFGEPSLKSHVVTRHRQGRSTVGACGARTSQLLALLKEDHYGVVLTPDDWQRLITWIDTYAQQRGAFSEEQEKGLLELRRRVASSLVR